MLYTTLTLSITFASITYDRCAPALADKMPLAVYFAVYSAITVTIYCVLSFCELFGRHSTLAVVDVPLTVIGALWVYSGAFTSLLARHDEMPLLMKIVASILTGVAFITAHLTYYDRSIRKMAPSVSGQAVGDHKEEDGDEEDANIEI